MPKRNHKQARIDAENDRLEQELAADVFGGAKFLKDAPSNHNTRNQDEPEVFSFEIDRVGEETEHPDPDEPLKNQESDNEESSIPKAATTTPAWVDPDDLQVNLAHGNRRLRKLRKRQSEDVVSSEVYEHRLRERFETTTQLTARTDWATLESAAAATSHQETVANVLTSADALIATQRPLPPNILNLDRCVDLNMDEPNKAVVQAVDFHRSSDPDRPIAVTAGLDKTLRFFQVTAEKSEKIHGIHCTSISIYIKVSHGPQVPKLPIMSASFLGSTGTVVATGRRSFFYLYDSVAGKLDFVPRLVGRQEKSLERSFASPDGRTVAFCGNDGFIPLFDIHNKAISKTVKMNGSVRAICFQGEHELLTSGSDGDVYRWDLRGPSRMPLERFSNQDGSVTSSIAVSDRTLAVGSESGVVNLFSEMRGRSKEPLKSILNIRTPIHHVTFNSDGNMVAMSSRNERDSLKIVHIPSRTVFSNWPTFNTPLNYVWTTSFSPGSKFLAVGNDKGKCLLYKLNHYHDTD